MNTNIALNTRRPRINALADRQAAMQIHGAEQASRLNSLKATQAEVALKQGAEIRNALSGADFSTPEGLRQVQNIYGQAGDAEQAIAIGEQLRGMDEAKLDIFNKRLDATSKLFNPNIVNDDASYQAAAAKARDLGIQIPEGPYEPEAVKALWMQSLEVKDVLAQQNAEITAAQNAVGKTVPYPDEVANQRASIARAGKSDVSVNTVTEREESKAYGKSLVSEYDSIRETAANANNELQNLRMLKNIDIDPGAAEPAKAFIGKWAMALGVPAETLDRMGINDVGTTQSFVGIAESLVLTKMQAQKGPQTENDAKRISKTVASLGNTPEAKEFLLNAAIALREREVEQADFYDRWRADKGTFDGARQAWNHWKSKTPLMGKNPNSGVPVFYQEFMGAMREANPDAPESEILKMWRNKYGTG